MSENAYVCPYCQSENIQSYNIALEDNEITQEDKDFLQTSIDLAYQIIYKFNKPQWNQL